MTDRLTLRRALEGRGSVNADAAHGRNPKLLESADGASLAGALLPTNGATNGDLSRLDGWAAGVYKWLNEFASLTT